MTESEFIKFYRKRNYCRNEEEAKRRIDLFWNVLLKALDENERVVFKGWGLFEKKEVKPRKIVIPTHKKIAYTKPKKAVKFKAGTKLVETVNKNSGKDE
ncbi:HU family DNA-binding protein [Fusobacterium sp.]|uniref:HU family DNA-binding protein n=1 Tax=Fusobacterium sp. TaxID=68766 RepID=UPI002902FA21|nr:HU family DNA-binding protein [Fusobacterium sp.]MDU1910616.1 HU family DNA-binding protein [Fusobacterium sp.]